MEGVLWEVLVVAGMILASGMSVTGAIIFSAAKRN